MSYNTVLTNLGAARIAAALSAGEDISLDSIHLGDGGGNPVAAPDPTRTTLINEVYSGPLNDLHISPASDSVIVVEGVIPSDVGGWNVTEVGIYDTTGALIAMANFPPTYKPADGENATRDLVIRLYIEVGADAAGIITVDPNVVIATRDWVQDNFSIAVLLPGGTTGQILSKASNVDGDFEWIDPLAGLNITVNVIEENQTLTAGQTVVNLLVATTAGIAVYIDGTRLRNDEYTINSATQFALAIGGSAGERLTVVQNEPAGGLDYLRAVNNLTDLESPSEARVNIGAASAMTSLQSYNNLSEVIYPAAACANIGAALDNAVLKKSQNLADVNDAASARANIGATTLSAVLQVLYPVGEILISRRGGNPATWLGFGTWEEYGAGKALVGYSAGESEFNAIDKAGGSKTHKLSVNEMPSHSHSVSLLKNSTLTVDAGGDLHHQSLGSENTSSVGGNQPHTNLQPYITVRFWKRTA